MKLKDDFEWFKVTDNKDIRPSYKLSIGGGSSNGE